MYHNTFQKEKNYDFLETIDIKGTADTFSMHKSFTLILFILLNISWKYIVCESNGAKKRYVSIV